MEHWVGGAAAQALLDRLQAEHRALERRLAELESRVGLTTAEQIERIEIKKLKLAKKDLILRERRRLAGGTPPSLPAVR